MKKLILTFAVFIIILTVGCTKGELTSTNVEAPVTELKVEKEKSLNEVYFNIVNKMEDYKDIEFNYIETLLSEYKCENENSVVENRYGDTIETNIYKNNKDEITLKNEISSTSKKTTISYELINGENEVYLSNCNNVFKDMYTRIILCDKDLYKKASAIIYNNESKLLKQYNKIIEDYMISTDLDFNELIQEISEEIALEPEVVNYGDESNYIFRDGAKSILVDYIKNEDRIKMLSYGDNDELLLINVMDENPIDNINTTCAYITSNLYNVENQKKIIDLLK